MVPTIDQVRSPDIREPRPAPQPPGHHPSHGRRTPALSMPTEEPRVGHRAPVRESSLMVQWRRPTIPLPRGPMGSQDEAARQMPRALPTLWCVDQERGIPRGALAYLIATGQNPSLIARGHVHCRPFLAARSDRVGTVGHHVIVLWGEILAMPRALPLEVLQAWVPDWDWPTADGSAAAVPAEVTRRIDRVWNLWTGRQITAWRPQ